MRSIYAAIGSFLVISFLSGSVFAETIKEKVLNCREYDSACVSRALIEGAKRLEPTQRRYFRELQEQIDNVCKPDDAVCAGLRVLYAMVKLGDLDRDVETYDEDLYCAVTQRGEWLPFRKNGERIGGGSAGYGFSSSSTCDSAIAGRRDGLICSWNGYSHLIYSISSGRLLGHTNQNTGAGFNTNSSCNSALEVQKNDFLCTWTGNGYLPVNLRNGYFVTPSRNSSNAGFNRLSSCQDAVTKSQGSRICTWSGYSTTGYVLMTRSGGEEIAAFGNEIDRCFSAL